MIQGNGLDVSPSYVLDASALLALLHGEPGVENVEPLIGRSVVSAVNLAEVLQKVIARGAGEPEEVRQALSFMGLRVADFQTEDAELSASLWAVGRAVGLSLADRACLSLARRLELPALTADRRWSAIDVQVEVRLIR